MAETIVVVSKVKALAKAANLRTGGDFIEALSNRVNDLVKNAIAKVQAEAKKKTIGAEDL